MVKVQCYLQSVYLQLCLKANQMHNSNGLFAQKPRKFCVKKLLKCNGVSHLQNIIYSITMNIMPHWLSGKASVLETEDRWFDSSMRHFNAMDSFCGKSKRSEKTFCFKVCLRSEIG